MLHTHVWTWSLMLQAPISAVKRAAPDDLAKKKTRIKTKKDAADFRKRLARLDKQEGNARLRRHLLAVESLDVTERRQVLQLIDASIERGQLRRKAQGKQAA